MKIRIKGVYSKSYRAADGKMRTYHYHRSSGARLPDDPTSPEFLLKVRELDRGPQSGAPAHRTLGDLMVRYRESAHFAKLRSSTRSEYARHMRCLEPLRDQPISGFRPSHADALEKRYIVAGKPTLGAAVRRTLSLLLGFAVGTLNWFDRNPVVGSGGIAARRQRNEEGQRPYEEHEILRFRSKTTPGTRARLSFELGLCTGLRIEDMTTVRRDQVIAGKISIVTSKSGSLVVLSVSKQLRGALVAYEEQCRRDWVETWRPGKTAISRFDGNKLCARTLSRELREAYVFAGFEEGQRTHALRYTAAVRLLEQGLYYPDIADIVGHRTADMARKYCAKSRQARKLGPIIDTIDGLA